MRCRPLKTVSESSKDSENMCALRQLHNACCNNPNYNYTIGVGASHLQPHTRLGGCGCAEHQNGYWHCVQQKRVAPVRPCTHCNGLCNPMQQWFSVRICPGPASLPQSAALAERAPRLTERSVGSCWAALLGSSCCLPGAGCGQG